MTKPSLTRAQWDIYDFLRNHDFPHPPSIAELCLAMGKKSRGSMHSQINALIREGLVEPMNNLKRGIRLVSAPELREVSDEVHAELDEVPFYGKIAAGRPIEAIAGPDTMLIPPVIRTHQPCYVLQIEGDSMMDVGILDGDMVVIEHRDTARTGDIVVALIDREEATLKRIEFSGNQIILHPENSSMEPQVYDARQVRIQGVLVGQMRSYRH